WVIITLLGLVVLVLITHAAASQARRREQRSRKVVLVGEGETAARVERRLTEGSTSMNLVACFGQPWGATAVRPVAELSAFVADNRVQEVWIAAPWQNKTLLDQAL